MVIGAMQPDSGSFTAAVDGKASLTEFEVVRREWRSNCSCWVTVVDLWPRTGRKHQLRVHLAAAGHPIVGEPRYLPDPENPQFSGWLARGVYLCAVELAFVHPVTGAALRWEVDEPAKFRGLIGRKPQPRGKRVARQVAWVWSAQLRSESSKS